MAACWGAWPMMEGETTGESCESLFLWNILVYFNNFLFIYCLFYSDIIFNSNDADEIAQ